MLENTGYGPSVRRRGSGNMLTHALMAVIGAALATGLLLAFYNPSPAAFPCREAERCPPRVLRPAR